MGLISIQCSEPNPGPFPKGRRCAEPDCITVLCRWNPSDHCYGHTPAEECSLAEQRVSLEDLMMDCAA